MRRTFVSFIVVLQLSMAVRISQAWPQSFDDGQLFFHTLWYFDKHISRVEEELSKGVFGAHLTVRYLGECDDQSAKLAGGQYTVAHFLDLNRVSVLETCTKEDLKRRVAFCKKLNKGERYILGEPRARIERNLYIMCRDSYFKAVGYCISEKKHWLPLGLMDKTYMSKLIDAWNIVNEEKSRELRNAGRIEGLPDIMGEAIINN